MYSHWMKTVHQEAKKTLEDTREAMKRYYDRKAIPQPNIEIGDLVMVNAKNIRTKRQSTKLSPKLQGPFKVLERRGNRAYKLEI